MPQAVGKIFQGPDYRRVRANRRVHATPRSNVRRKMVSIESRKRLEYEDLCQGYKVGLVMADLEKLQLIHSAEGSLRHLQQFGIETCA